MSKRKIIKGSATLALGEASVYGLSFLRNMLLARILTRADFGTAATFSIVVTIFELGSKMAAGRLIIQDKRGTDPVFIATAHTIQALCGILSGSLVFCAAGPLAKIFGFEQAASALQWLAPLPILRGFENLGTARAERDLNFVPSTLMSTIPQVLMTVAAWPIASWMPDFRAVLILLMIKAVASAAVSQVVAKDRYRLSFNGEYARAILKFGWPLLINGFFMFGVFQGDQFIVASYYPMDALGVFVAAGAIATAPTFIFTRILPTLMLPVLARIQDDHAAFTSRYNVINQIVATVCVVYSFCLICGGEAIMQIAYGGKYAGTGHILAWIAAANAFRIIRIGAATAALAKADSKNQMVSNLYRVSSLVPALIVALEGGPIWAVASCALAGEIFAYGASLTRLARHRIVPISTSILPAVACAVSVTLAGLAASSGLYTFSPSVGAAIATVACMTAGLTVASILPNTRRILIAGATAWNSSGIRGLISFYSNSK